MIPDDIAQFVGILLGAFGLGYVGGFLLLQFKRAAGLIS